MPENFKAGTNQPPGFGAASRTPIPPLARFAHRLVETLTAFIDRLRIAGSWPRGCGVSPSNPRRGFSVSFVGCALAGPGTAAVFVDELDAGFFQYGFHCDGVWGSMTDSSPAAHNGEKRPADVISAAITVARIATGEIEGAKGKLYLDFFDR